MATNLYIYFPARPPHFLWAAINDIASRLARDLPLHLPAARELEPIECPLVRFLGFDRDRFFGMGLGVK